MQLVDVIEAEIGAPVEAWPSSILTLLFAFDPTCLTLSQTCRRSLRFSLAIMCLSIWLVNSSVLAASNPFLLSNIILPTYITCGPSLYYDLHEDRYKYTDGTYATSFDDAIPDFGYEHIGFPTVTRTILLQTNQIEYVEN